MFENKIVFLGNNAENGLTYSNATVQDLVTKDTDGDGVPDWEETLYGLDPNNKETTPGIPDSTAMAKMQSSDKYGSASTTNNDGEVAGVTTKTDQFSQQLFATVTALNQNGSIDPNTVDQISGSLANQIQNSTPRKVYLISDIKVLNDNSAKAAQTYFDSLDALHKKYPASGNVVDILQRATADQNNINTNALSELDPIIAQLSKIIAGLET
ncbi:MAG: hypothetical protein ACREGC_01950, partial [Minisyncoccia bacterium]